MSGFTGWPRMASTMKACQVRAGSVPPVTFFMGALSSLPSQTPVTRSAVKPSNQASR